MEILSGTIDRCKKKLDINFNTDKSEVKNYVIKLFEVRSYVIKERLLEKM